MTANKGEAGWAAMFDDADRDKNGFMTVQELRDMMKRNNSSITESEIVVSSQRFSEDNFVLCISFFKHSYPFFSFIQIEIAEKP